jgi:hypothetical protein
MATSQHAHTAASKDVEMPIEVRKLSIAAEEVREAIEVEHALTFWEAVRLYPKAIGWSMYFSLGVIMLGMPCFHRNATLVHPKIASTY